MKRGFTVLALLFRALRPGRTDGQGEHKRAFNVICNSGRTAIAEAMCETVAWTLPHGRIMS
jgi:hypothetical protein